MADQNDGGVPIRDAAELGALLDVMQQRAQASLGTRAMATVGLMAGGFLLPGAAGMASFCMAAVSGIAAIAAAADYVCRNLLIDLMAFHEVIRPRDESACLLASLLVQQTQEDAETTGN